MRKIDRINGKVHMCWLPQVGNFAQNKCWWNLMWLGVRDQTKETMD